MEVENAVAEGTPPVAVKEEPAAAAVKEEPVVAEAAVPETAAETVVPKVENSVVAADDASIAAVPAAAESTALTPMFAAPIMATKSRVVQITNIAPQATRDTLLSLFVNVGQIEDIRLYPSVRDASVSVTSRCCFIKFADDSSVAISQHMNNTVFIDRAIIVSLVPGGEIPDEFTGMTMAQQRPGFPNREQQEVKMPPNMLNRIEGVAPNAKVRQTQGTSISMVNNNND